MRVAVVGAGVAGLSVATALRAKGHTVIVLEARDKAGGRVRSVYDKHGGLAYEAGPWRIPRSHRKALALFRAHGATLRPLEGPPITEEHAVATGLSTWEANALRAGDPREADRLDLATGYADETHSASVKGRAPYLVEGRDFYVSEEGFSAVMHAMAAALPDVRYQCRVTDVVRHGERQYEVRYARRTGHNAFEAAAVRADALFVCVPPGVSREWELLATHARSTLCAVEPGALHHIYVEDARVPRGVHVKDPLLGQTITTQPYPAWFQASYTGGRLARLWHNLRLQDPAAFGRRLRAELARLLGGYRVPATAAVASHHWPVAYHTWRAVPDFDLARAVRLAVEPNPVELPRLYFAGEAFSSHQAWMEGALETAALAVSRFLTAGAPRRASAPRCAGDWCVQVDGRALDVSAWQKVHPGGVAPLRNHLGEDVGALMAHFGHSDHAWAVAHALKCDG